MPRKLEPWRIAGSHKITVKTGPVRSKRTGRFIKQRSKIYIFKVTKAKEAHGVTYRVKMPKGLPREKRTLLSEAIVKVMRKDGQRNVPGTKTFYPALEGRAFNKDERRRMKGVTSISRSADLKETQRAIKSKILGLLEGNTLSNDPFKKNESGALVFLQGPDTIYVTAIDVKSERRPRKRKRGKTK
jgi:hypothetical protein